VETSDAGTTSHSEELFAAWEADSWWPPEGVRAVFGGPSKLTLHVEGRRKPVVGQLARLDDGEVVYVPENKNGRSGTDCELLDGVAEVMGLRASKRRAGRPRGGLGDRAARKAVGLTARGIPQPTALEAVRAEVGWGELRPGESPLNREHRRQAGQRAVRREVERLRTKARDQQRDQ